MNEYDMRQLHNMSQKINEFKKENTSLEDLTKTLEHLIESLENIDPMWKNSFIGFWAYLEEASALILTGEQNSLSKRNKETLLKAIHRLNILLDYEFQTYGDKFYKCPCCKFFTLAESPPGTHEICNVCNWEDDYVQFNDPKLREGTNHRSLLEAQEQFKATGRTCVNQVEKPY